MHKQEVNTCQTYFNIQQLFDGQKVCMQHMSFKGYKRKITMSGCSE